MIPVQIIVLVSLLYFGLLFAVASYADRRREAGRSVVSNPHVYALSLAVYFTSWTFYGSVGRAATVGLDFLPADLGPTLCAFSWWYVLRKMVRISKQEKITSIADFISSRYGKSVALGAIITLFTVVGIMPYIALQLKGIAYSFNFLAAPAPGTPTAGPPGPDHALLFALILAVFSVLFGARKLQASERHEGLVAAIALEAVVKLIAFLAVGLFVTYGLFGGFGDIFSRFVERFPERGHLLLVGTEQIPYATWFTMLLLSMSAILVLPRQFHIMVIENSDEKHIRSAMWRYPAYSYLINLFVMPIALGGLLLYGGDTALADFFVIQIPLQSGHQWLALLAFIGGFSASAGMVMVSSVAISTMILNHLLMPLILKLNPGGRDLSRLLLQLKRLGILAVILLGYAYYRLLGESYALVNIGLVSFMAAAQFAPSVLGGLYWKRGNRLGAMTGLILGFLAWSYTLLLPFFVRSGWLPGRILEQGPFGLAWLRPLELFGLTGLDIWTHALFWTLFVNVGAYIFLSLFTTQTELERHQALRFVDVFKAAEAKAPRQRLSRAPSVIEFVDLMSKFIGKKQAHATIASYLEDAQIDAHGSLPEAQLPELKRFTEKTLAAAVGAAPARIIIENYLAARGSRMEDVFDIFGSVTISREASREQLGVLYQTARLVAGGEELQRVLDNILALFREQFRFDLCVIRVLDDQARLLRVKSQQGMSSRHLGGADRTLDQESYVGEAFLNSSLVVANDTAILDKPAAARLIHQEGIKSFAHAPIVVEGEAVGVLSTFSRSARGIFTDEFLQLYRSLADQVGVALRNARQTERIISARERERELEIARAIQLGLLPERIPQVSGIALGGACLPARQVGGDYYDFLPTREGGLDAVIADVSGHSVGAALTMGWIRTFIRDRFETGRIGGAAELLASLNRFFHRDLQRAELFVTLFFCRYDPATRLLRYASAGHNPPLLWRAVTGECRWLDAEGLILGILERVEFEERRLTLHPGDLLLLYTDGLTEAERGREEFFGEARLCELVSEHHRLPPQELIERLLEEGRRFTGRVNFNDDVTLVAMKVEG